MVNRKNRTFCTLFMKKHAYILHTQDALPPVFACVGVSQASLQLVFLAKTCSYCRSDHLVLAAQSSVSA